MNFKKLTDLPVTGKRVFIRADLNVPQDDAGAITDDTRIRAALPGIRYCLEKGAAVMVTSHLGRPTEGELKPEDSLAPIGQRMAELLGRPVRLVQNWVDGGFSVAPGEVVLLENCRCNKGEKKNSDELAQKMAKLCDIYANDAFGTAHRAEATTHGIAKYAPIACAGPCVAAELEALTKALAAPKRPLMAIVGGSKVSTKLTVLESLAGKVDQLVVGGGIANTFLLAAGKKIGKSLAEPDLLDQAKREFPEGTQLSRPAGGYFLWVRLPPGVNALDLHREALQNDIGIAPGPMFSSQRRFEDYVRINCGHEWNLSMADAIRRLGELVRRLRIS